MHLLASHRRHHGGGRRANLTSGLQDLPDAGLDGALGQAGQSNPCTRDTVVVM